MSESVTAISHKLKKITSYSLFIFFQPLTGMPTLSREPEPENSDEDEEDDDYLKPKLPHPLRPGCLCITNIIL